MCSHLHKLVPAAANNDRVLRIGRESDARNPIGMSFVGDSELAVTKSVPELDGAIARARNNLSVVGGEADGQNIVGVANKSAGSRTGREFPETEGLVPGGRESVCTIGRDDLDILSAYVLVGPQIH